MKAASDPKDVQEFLFKQSSVCRVFDAVTSVPPACNLLAADKKRGLLYIAQNSKLLVFKPGEENNPEWKVQIDLPTNVSKIALSCDYSYLAVTPLRPAVLIYDAYALARNNLQLLHEIRVSSSNTDAFVTDIRWNPTIPGMLFTVANDYTVGSFQIKEEKEKTIGLKALERIDGLDVMCAAWSPKGKQVVVGCKNGNIVQLKPDLKVARMIPGPNPYIGEVITILWISNYQFCAAYLGTEQRINVLIVDAPKGETNAIFTYYEDITYGMPEVEGEGTPPRYYFDHIPEWGLIIAASSASSEIAVLGSTDNGGTWNQWQLVDSGRAQLPLIKTTESYPIGLAIDRSSTRKLPWGADSTLPNPVPVLHILGTSGQLCSFHMVNLTPNCPPTNSPPDEIVTAPSTVSPQPRPSIAPSEMSFNLLAAATSTPQPKQIDASERPRPAPITNIFGDSLKAAGFFQQGNLEQQKLQETPKPAVSIVTSAPPMMRTLKGTPATSMISMTSVTPTVTVSNKEITREEVPKQEIKSVTVKEAKPQPSVEQKVNIDDSICVRAYLEEQALFEKELKNRLEPQVWECGTEEESVQLGERAVIIDQFVRDLRETTNSLCSDIAYLKALLLQSFAWLEETKSKNAANVDITTRACGDNSKIAELQRLYYYTRSQLIQATKILDLEWSQCNADAKSRMKIPSLEMIYQNLSLHNRIIIKEKAKIEELTRKWKQLGRSHSVPELCRSMSSLHIPSPKFSSNRRGYTSVIEARCKAIALKTSSFTHEKQIKLKNLLLEASPKIIKPVSPSPVQDRLEATLSSLASLSPLNVDTKSKMQQSVTKQTLVTKQANQEKPKLQSPLASLNSIVARIGTNDTSTLSNVQQKVQSKPVSTSIAFSSTAINKAPAVEKKQPVVPATSTLPPAKPKQDLSTTFSQVSTAAQSLPSLTKSFSKPDSFSFTAAAQKLQETVQQPKSPPKETSVKNVKESAPNNNLPNGMSSLFSTDSLKDVLTSEFTLPKGLEISATVSKIPVAESVTTFSFATSATAITKSSTPEIVSSSSTTNQQPFSFASKPASTFSFAAKPPVSQPVQSSLDLSGMSLGIQSSNVSNSVSTDAKTVPASETAATSTFSFGKSTLQVFPTSTTTQAAVSTAQSSTSAVTIVPSKSTDVTSSTLTIPNGKISTNTPSVPTFGSSAQTTPSSTTSLFGSQPPSTSIFGGTSAMTSTAPTFNVSLTPSTATPTFGTQLSAQSTATSGGFSTISSATPTFSSLAITSTSASTFPTSLSKPTFSEGTAGTAASTFAVTTAAAPTFAVTSASAPTFAVTSTSAPTFAVTSTSAPTFAVTSTSAPTFAVTSTSAPTFAVTSTSAPTFAVTSSSAPTFAVTSASPSTFTFGNAVTITTTASAFGKAPASPLATTAASPTNVFAKPIKSPTFGTPSNAPIFGKITTTSASTSMFGGTNTMFGSTAPSSTGANIFGGGGSTNIFGTAATKPDFKNSPPKPSGLMFGGSTVGTTPPFGGNAGTASPTGSNLFGSPGGASPATTIGGSTVETPSLFGSGIAQPAFGQAPTFGYKPVFGSGPTFGASKPVFGSGFGTSTFGAPPTPLGGFGSPPTIGGNPPLGNAAPVFGTSTGSSTFESLASQSGGLTFGSLAQKSPEQEKPVFQGGSSFSSWR